MNKWVLLAISVPFHVADLALLYFMVSFIYESSNYKALCAKIENKEYAVVNSTIVARKMKTENSLSKIMCMLCMELKDRHIKRDLK